MRNSREQNQLITNDCVNMHALGIPLKDIAAAVRLNHISVWKRLRKAGIPPHSHAGGASFVRPKETEQKMIERGIFLCVRYDYRSEKDKEDIDELEKSVPIPMRFSHRDSLYSSGFRSSMQNHGEWG